MEEHSRSQDSVKEKDDLREEARKLGLFAKEFQWTRRAAAKSKRQDERKGYKSPSGPENDPKSSKMKILLSFSKSCKP